MHCPNCNLPNPDGTEFCLTCGTDLPGVAAAAVPATGGQEADAGKCPDCGAGNPEDALFCGLCGRDFQPASPAVGDLPPVAEPMRDAGEQKLGVPRTLELARSELAAGHEESAAKILLAGMRNHPRDSGLRKFFRESFDDSKLRRMHLRVAPAPVWNEFARIVLYPLRGGEWGTILVGGVVLGLMEFIARYAFFYAIFIYAVIAAYAANVMVRHLKWASVGRPGHPGIVEFHFGDLAYVVASSLATMWPSIALVVFMGVRMFSVVDINPTGVVVTLVMAGLAYVIGSLFQPMSLLVASLFNRWSMAFDYSFILRSLRVVWKDYAFAWLLLIAIGGLQVLFGVAVRLMPGSAFILLLVCKWILELYHLALLGHVLGRVYYSNEQRLAWFDDLATQPRTSPVGFAVMAVGLACMFGLSWSLLGPGPKTRARKECRAAFAALAAGKPDVAMARADAALRIVPAYAGAHMAKARAYMAKQDYRRALAEVTEVMRLSPCYAPARDLRHWIKIRMRPPRSTERSRSGLAPERKMQLAVRRKFRQYRNFTGFTRPPEMVFDDRLAACRTGTGQEHSASARSRPGGEEKRR